MFRLPRKIGLTICYYFGGDTIERNGKMTAIAKTGKVRAQNYAELLTTALPKPIETEAENERALEIVNRLMRGSAGASR